tara:strand:- start:1231 stop:1464 length:234 start_codon:yes stop_codon:yes gene_type:complete
MIIKTRSVKQLARDSGLNEELIDRNLDALCEFTWRIAKRERKYCGNKIRGWLKSTDIVKAPLIDLLKVEDEEEPDYL